MRSGFPAAAFPGESPCLSPCLMKKLAFLSLASAVALTSLATAGTTTVVTDSMSTPPPPPPVYGTGCYVALQAGANVYQDFSSRRFSLGGQDVTIDPQDNVGFVGGIKAGYVFGTGVIRPAVEADLYYNGVEADVDAKVNGRHANFNANGDLNSGAFMANFLVRFAFDRFQPYVGGGVGGYYAESDDIEVKVGGRKFHSDGGSNGGFAWQIIAGMDYYWTTKVSTFVEYKFLNYEDAGFDGDRVGQQIVVLGLRWHF